MDLTGFVPKKKHKEYILSLLMFILGVYSVILLFKDGIDDINGILSLISSVFMVLMALFLFVHKRKNKMRAVGFFALALGFNRITTVLPLIMSPDDLIFLYGMVMSTLGASMLYSGYMYLTGTSRNPFVMRVSALLVIGTYLFTLISYHISGLGMDFYIRRHPEEFIAMLMYVAYALILYDDEIVLNTPTGKIMEITNSISYGTLIPGDSYILRSSVREILNISEGKSVGNSSGPVISEISIPVYNGKSDTCIIIQRWKNDENLYLTFSQNPTQSCSGYDFSFRTVRTDTGNADDCSNITLYSEDGRMLKISVSKTEVNPYVN